MARIEVTRMELVWPGKYDEDGRIREVERARLPFQVIERIKESRATREANRLPKQSSLFDIYEAKEGDSFEEGWHNKLIWGDNLLVMGSLLEKFAGKIDLIYIDPPFATGADFSIRTYLGEDEITKEASLIEEKAYRDTWGRGLESFIQMLFERFQLIRDLLSDEGTIYVHMGWDVSHYVKAVLDEVFGNGQFVNQIIWKRQTAHSDIGQGSKHLGPIHDVIFLYTKGETFPWNMQYQPYSEEYVKAFYKYIEPETGRRYRLSDITGPGGAAKGNPYYEFLGVTRYWRFKRERMEEMYQQGRIVQTKPGTVPAQKRYLDEMPGNPLQDLWLDINTVQPQAAERLGYDTQKPDALLDRIIKLSSNPGSLVADFFCGSGTTLASAEKLGRRWIGCDLGRFAIHTTRKRLLGIENCRPFEVLNLGKYERQYWHGVTFGNGKHVTEQVLYEYLAFILKLYSAQPLAGLTHLHGKKDRALVHIGAVDAPVTIDEINLAMMECSQLKQKELHVLGWEWEMGLRDLIVQEAMTHGIKLVLLTIPREVMEQQAVDKGDIKFFELAYLEVEIQGSSDEEQLLEMRARPASPGYATQHVPASRVSNQVKVVLKNFVISNSDLLPKDVNEKVKKWSDYIDYWAVDWDFQNDTFMNGWVAYRIRKERFLALQSQAHTYEHPGRYTIVVKVVDIFGNDTTQAYDMEVC
jgi:adenine-specific DNA-methyltransferase